MTFLIIASSLLISINISLIIAMIFAIKKLKEK